ncbi:MAG: hypothetical protein HYX72_07435 [Acidobacteria bacterium]|nr:hypothetical protein [Acidobacteriota bacterium]
MKNVRVLLRTALTVSAILTCTTAGFSQATCTVSTAAPLVRSQGLTEQIGTILFTNCAGSIPPGGATVAVSIQPATALITNSPAAGFVPTAVISTTTGGVTSVAAVVSGAVSSNTATFGIPATAAGATLASIQIGAVPGLPATVPIRVNAFASGVSFPNQVTALLSSSPSGALAVDRSVVSVAFPLPGVTVSFAPGASIFQGTAPALAGVPQTAAFVAGALPAFTATDTTTSQAVGASSIPIAVVTEGFASALLVAGTPPAGNGEGSDTSGIGTRVLIRLNNLPANVAVYAPQLITTTTAGGALTLALVTGADSNGAGGSILAGSAATASLISGTTVTYETVASSLLLIERADIPLGLFTTGIPTSTTMTMTVFVAPVSSIATAVATTTAPIPRFADVAAPQSVAPGPPTIAISSNTLGFTVPFGASPSPQTLRITNAGGGVLNWTAAISSITGGNWLTLSPTSGAADTNISISVNSSSLAVGTYSATVLFSVQGATNTPLPLTVTVNVTSTSLFVTSSSLNFSSLSGSNPPAQQVGILSGGGVLSWIASVSSGVGNWLSILPNAGTTPSSALVMVNTAGLSPGTYQGVISISATGASNTQNVIVTLTLGAPAPVVVPNGVLNGASFSREAVISPGSLVSLFGTDLATTTASISTPGAPLTLGGTQVLINESPAPLLYVSPSQINFQLPPGTQGPIVQVVVVSNGVRGTAATATVASTAPGIFTSSPGGIGQGAVLNQDSSLNSPQNPAQAGSIVQIFATGLGATNPPAVSGQPAGISPLSETVVTPVVLIGGVQAEVTYSGLAPTTVGVYQINARIPAGMAAGSAVPLQVRVGSDVASNVVTLAVR